ncbi:MAG: aminotransferase class I/II-fold pyridoxal phosphate-dependent enzyme [Roseococcus sp.]|nr:aminotransferase class I/II-fold pyridoxal phosphate-dependent enzyme [Roseococcus sp.]
MDTDLAAPAAEARPSSVPTPAAERRRQRLRIPQLPLARSSPSFAEHPAFLEITRGRVLTQLAGLRDPYYRRHEGRAGPRTSVDGRTLLNFTSYDYLGLNGHPEVLAAHQEAAERFGTTVSGSRLTSGEREIHAALEAALAEVYGAEAGLLFVSGHATPASVFQAILNPGDLILHDALMHNCAVVGAAAARCHRRAFRHNDLDQLERLLARSRHEYGQVLIVTEGLFSMDGDGVPLDALLRIKERYGAWLMVDEAHALGTLGATGRGSHEHAGVDPARVDIWFGTLSKALVSCGGYVCGARPLIEILRARAPGLVYSVGMPAPTAAASLAALRVMRREPERVARLQALSRRFHKGLRAIGADTGTAWGVAILPTIIGSDLGTLQTAEALEALGVLAFPVVQPGVPEGAARLRFFISAAHEEKDLDRALVAIAEVLPRQ